MPKDEPIARASLITSHIVGIIFQCWPLYDLTIREQLQDQEKAVGNLTAFAPFYWFIHTWPT